MNQIELARVTEAIERAQEHWQERHSARGPGAEPWPPHPANFTVALSREAGAPGTSVGRAVGERLHWAVYDNELLEHIARQMGLRTALLESVDERSVSWLEECMEAFSVLPNVTEGAFVRHLVATLLSLAAHGDCIIVGRGAAFVLPPSTTLRVRLTATREDRITATSRRLGLAPTEAARWVENTDRQRVRFVKDHFQKDPTEVEHFDLLLNASRFSVDECAEMIVTALRRLQLRAPAPEVATV